MEGWIKLHRKFLDHWLCDEYRPLTKREAWENILFWANYKDDKMLIKGQVIECKRGQICYSLDTWSKKFNWSVSQVRQFFKLLQNDKMIKVEGLKYTTRLTVCNFDNYQDKQQTDNKLITNSLQTDCILPATSKEDKKEKNIYNDFYDLEIKNNEDKQKIIQYKILVSFLFGENELKKKMDIWLNLRDQLTYEQFEKLLVKSIVKKKKIKDMIISGYNDKKYLKGKLSFYATLDNWLNR